MSIAVAHRHGFADHQPPKVLQIIAETGAALAQVGH
jgi:hypothetical protein